MRKVQWLPAASLLLLGQAGNAAAAEYCVTCEGPAALYRCVVEGTPEGAGKDPSSSLYCISQMAKRGRHESCAVSRGAPFPCPGLTATVVPPADMPIQAQPPAGLGPGAPLPAAETPPLAPSAPEEQNAAAPPDDAAKVPRTVEELAGQTMKSSKEGLEKAGEAIGGTAKKAGEHIGNAGTAIGSAAANTWNCLTSLFKSCGGSETEAAPEAAPPAQ
jgi:hypothetical protein